MNFDNYYCDNQMTIFDFIPQTNDFKIKNKIRLIELFAGIGAQAKALERIGANFERYKISEWEVNACASYHMIHRENDNTDYSRDLSDNELIEILDKFGLSVDGKNPMSINQIVKKGEKWRRKVYNDFKATNNLGSITKINGKDLEIIETDRFTYLLTYSFPCQDLSVAGKQKGMSKGSSTRSGLLWEVERLLNEVESLPQVLLMENVPQVHGSKFIADFDKWSNFLESKGYTNFWKDLNAKDYGVAQSRNRCFMVSILGNYSYKFPEKKSLEKTMCDYLEDEVDSKFYVTSDKAKELIDKLIKNGTILTDRQTDRQTVDFSLESAGKNFISNCICARYDKGISKRAHEGSCVCETTRLCRKWNR